MTATTRRVPVFVLAVIAAVGLLGIPVGPTAPPEVRAALPDLTVVSAARYDVQPDQRRVRVTVDLTLTNRLKDTATRLFYFDHALFDVLPGASGFKVTTEASGTPTVRALATTKDYTRLRIDLGSRLRSGKSAIYRLTFDLKDPGGAPTRDLRIGDSLVSFPVWSFASDDTPGSSVVVVFPAGYEVAVEAGKIPAPTTGADGRTIFRTGTLAKPLDFFAYLVADRPGAYQDTTISTDVLDAPVEVLVRAWSDDAAWSERVGDLVERALPAMGDRIGLPWPAYDPPLTVREAVSRSTGGYAGLFDPREGRVDIAYYADDFVILHEAAHAWFNGSLLADRWASEAFASYYGSAAAFDLELKVATDVLTDELQASRIALNDWGPVGSEAVAAEDYAYAAALEVARLIAARAGGDGLRAVWADAAAGVGAYQPLGGGTETVEGPPDWRGLLDLLEARTAATYDDLWRTWIARPTDLPLLDARAEARARFAAIRTQAADWRLPEPIRDALRAWQFDDAMVLLDGAGAALEARAEVEAAADAAGLVPPASLRSAFEDSDGFEDAAVEARAELDTIARYEAAVALRPGEVTPLIALGLWGETPELELTAARAAFARGDLQAAQESSGTAAAVWGGAASLGQDRALSIAAIVLALVMLIALAITNVTRRRRRVTMQATRIRG